MIRLILTLGLILVMSGCSSSYDKGFEDGYEGKEERFFYVLDKKYKEGYEKGAMKAYYLELGCHDAGKYPRPRHPRNVEYMKKYKECGGGE